MNEPRILFVAKAPGLADRGARLLEALPGIAVSRLSDPRAALDWVNREPVDVLIIELPMTADIASLARTARRRRPGLAVLGLCCSSLQSEWRGPLPRFECDEVLVLPFAPDQLTECVRRLAYRPHDPENAAEKTPPELVGVSEPLSSLLDMIERLGPLDVEVLIQGPAGSPRATVARQLQALDPHRNGPFVNADCRLDEPGQVRWDDSLAVARNRWKCLLEASAEGVLFLDHLDRLPRTHQAILQNLLTDSQREGRGHSVRLVSAAEVSLEEELDTNEFRRDLFYRLSTVKIELPSLEQRSADLPELCAAFLARISGRRSQPRYQLTVEALELLEQRPWPGDISALHRLLIEASELARGPLIEDQDIRAALQRATALQP